MRVQCALKDLQILVLKNEFTQGPFYEMSNLHVIVYLSILKVSVSNCYHQLCTLKLTSLVI